MVLAEWIKFLVVSEQVYYYTSDYKRSGPIPFGELRALAEQGIITANTTIETDDRLFVARKMTGLFAAESNYSNSNYTNNDPTGTSREQEGKQPRTISLLIRSLVENPFTATFSAPGTFPCAFLRVSARLAGKRSGEAKKRMALSVFASPYLSKVCETQF